MKVIAVLLFLFGLSQAKRFSQCNLAKELLAQGLPRNELADWVCLVEAESSRDTSKKGGPNRNGSYDHGLFQINDKYWCKNGQKGGDCNVKCEDLRADDISASIKCAQKVKKRHGFNAWYGWKNNCKGKPLPNINNCF
uniref:lysozyme n=1 Tax=Ectomocoris sp. TaxID=3104572 RepID=A0AB38ZEA5_9HEMI